jgi:ribonuclease III
MNKNFLKIEKNININFKDKSFLIKTFTHKSYDPISNYEKLEFLGDRVLGLIISKRLLEIYPNEKEGSLDKKLASLVNKKKCLEIAKSLNLDQFILIGNTKEKQVKIEGKIIADVCESLIGAIFLDQGLKITEKFILRVWDKDLKDSITTFIDAKTRLQEYSLKRYKSLPLYKLIKNSGPRHKPFFEVSVELQNSKTFVGKGTSKKQAEQNAANLFLNTLEIK